MNNHALGIIRDSYQANTVRVSYEDMRNSWRIGTVVESRGGEFRVMWDDEEGGETWSDLRQPGWRPVPFAVQSPYECPHGCEVDRSDVGLECEVCGGSPRVAVVREP